jgi:hypothetical protein
VYRLHDAMRDKEFLLVFSANSLALAYRRAGGPPFSSSHCARLRAPDLSVDFFDEEGRETSYHG